MTEPQQRLNPIGPADSANAFFNQALTRNRQGATWNELREKLSLPYDRPCPEWTRRLEKEIGLTRSKTSGRALLWQLQKTASKK